MNKFVILLTLLSNSIAFGQRDSLYICANVEDTNDCYPVHSLDILNSDNLDTTKVKRSVMKSAGSMNETIYEINIWVTVPFDDTYMFSKHHVEPAVYQALEDAGSVLCSNFTRDGTEFPLNTCFVVTMNDTKCDADYSMTQTVEIQNSRILAEDCNADDVYSNILNMNVFLGMTCDFSAGRVGALSNNWGWPSIFPGARTVSLDNKSLPCCGTLTRTGHTATDVGRFVLRLYQEFDWSRSYLVYSATTNHGAPVDFTTASDCTTFIGGITSEFRSVGWSQMAQYTLYYRANDMEVINTAEKILEEIKNNARVSLWCVGRKAMRYIMNKASKMGMTDGDFAFLYLDIYNTNTSYTWSNVDDQECQKVYPPSNPYCDVDEGNSSAGMRALHVISLRQSPTSTYRKFSDAMLNKMNLTAPDRGEFVNPFVTQYYNAARLLIQGLNKTVDKNDTDLSDGQAFAQSLWNTSFESVDGTVTISETGDQLMDYSLMDMDPETEIFRVVLSYAGANQTITEVEPIDWPGNTPPVNKPECGYGPCPGETNWTTEVKILVGVISFLLLILLIAFIILYRRMKTVRKLKEMAWKVRHAELDYGPPNRRNSNSTHSIASDAEVSEGGERITTRFIKTARWKGQFVAVKPMPPSITNVNVDKKDSAELQTMLSLNHRHLCKFFGAAVEAPVVILYEYCSHGSLQDFLAAEVDKFMENDMEFRNSLISDIVNGMQYLHKSPIHSHGKLKSSNCLIDGQLAVKITDFGLSSFRPSKEERRDSVVGYNHCKDLLWTAPELLREDEVVPYGTQKGDVYSFAVIVQEIIYRKGTFYRGVNEEEISPDEIINRVSKPTEFNFEIPFRPTLEDNDDVVIESKLRSLVKDCWDEDCEKRPTFTAILSELRRGMNMKTQNLVDNLLKRLENYSTRLEEKVEERTMQYKSQKDRADDLLYQMLPKSVAERLKHKWDVPPEKFDCVTIYFSDIVGFTAISHDSTPLQVVEMLDRLYKMFDDILDALDVYKVETIGDAYMVVSGLPERNDNLHVREIARMSLQLLEGIKKFEIPHKPETQMRIRIGIHSGPVVAGCVGKKMPRYCLFGDTVNTAARMEQRGEALKIHISPNTKRLLEEFDGFVVKERDEILDIKGLGKLKTYWLEGEVNDNFSLDDFHLNKVDFLNAIDAKRVSDSSGYSSIRTSFEVGYSQIPVSGVTADHSEDVGLPHSILCDSQITTKLPENRLNKIPSCEEFYRSDKDITVLPRKEKSADEMELNRKNGYPSSTVDYLEWRKTPQLQRQQNKQQNDVVEDAFFEPKSSKNLHVQFNIVRDNNDKQKPIKRQKKKVRKTTVYKNPAFTSNSTGLNEDEVITIM